MLLIAVHFFGITASGSTRWIDLFVFNLQPSELMKIGLIVFLARYYNRRQANKGNKRIDKILNSKTRQPNYSETANCDK